MKSSGIFMKICCSGVIFTVIVALPPEFVLLAKTFEPSRSHMHSFSDYSDGKNELSDATNSTALLR